MRKVSVFGPVAAGLLVFSSLSLPTVAAAVACNPPGPVVTTDPAGDPTPNGSSPAGPTPVGQSSPGDTYDILSVSIAEPAHQPGKRLLAITLQVTSLKSLPSSSYWWVHLLAGGADNFVSMRTPDASATNPAPIFEYGNNSSAGFSLGGPLESTSSYDADKGTITYVVSTDHVGVGGDGFKIDSVTAEAGTFGSAASQPLVTNPWDETSNGKVGGYTMGPDGACGILAGSAPVQNGIPPKPIAFSQYTSPPSFGNNAGEPSIGVDVNPNVAALKQGQINFGGVVFFQSGPNTLRASFDDSKVPAVAKWEDVSTAFVQQFPLSDPIGFVDRQTGRVFALDLIGFEGQSFMAFSDDDGNSWTPTEGGPPAGSPDHETLASGPYTSALAGLGPVYPNAVYYCGQALVGTNFCSRSDDGGLTFGPQIPTVHAPDCVPEGAQNGHVKVGPDGTVYLPQGHCPGLVGPDVAAVSISQDNGLTWTFSAVPNSSSPALDPAVAIDAGNNVYLTWADADHHPHVAVSKDHGATWIHDTNVGAPFGIKNADFVIATAGDAGRAAVGFIGTPTAGDSRSASAINTFTGVWHLYIAITYDGGTTWTTIDGTPHDPVQVGSVCTSGTLCGADRNLLDFNDLQIDGEGRILAGFADGCLAPNCNEHTAAGKPPYTDSRDNKAAILRQACGLGLLAKYDAKLGAAACVTTVPEVVAPIAPDASCHMPGVQVITSPPGNAYDESLPTGQDDLLAVYFAEPSDQPGKLVITMKVNNLNPTPPPQGRWIVYLKLPTSADLYWVAMSTADGPLPAFNYGTKGSTTAGPETFGTFNTLGTVDGTWSADGTIQFVLDTSSGPFTLKAGNVLTNIAAETRQTSTPSAANNMGFVADSATGTNYTVVKNQCSGAGGGKSAGVLLGGSFGLLTLFPLFAAGLARRRKR